MGTIRSRARYLVTLQTSPSCFLIARYFSTDVVLIACIIQTLICSYFVQCCESGDIAHNYHIRSAFNRTLEQNRRSTPFDFQKLKSIPRPNSIFVHVMYNIKVYHCYYNLTRWVKWKYKYFSLFLTFLNSENIIF